MQHKPGDWDFAGPLGNNYNLTSFLVKARQHGLFVNLRFGPYVCAEWNFGGFPLWLTDVPGLVDRTSAPAWEAQMGAFFAHTAQTVRDFFADRGGPIALAQVENEYGGGDMACACAGP